MLNLIKTKIRRSDSISVWHDTRSDVMTLTNVCNELIEKVNELVKTVNEMEKAGGTKMLNKSILIGRLCKDPEVKYIPSGKAVTTFTLAVDRSFTNAQGEREADFIPCVVWDKLAETCGKYLSKGRLTAVSGRIQTRTYDAQDGTKRYITEIVADEVQFLERAKEQLQEPPAPPTDKVDFTPMDDDPEGLPF